MWFTYENEHRDFEQDPRDSQQKLKGSVSFSLDMDNPPNIGLEIEIKKKRIPSYKIKERKKDVKGNSGKLF
jgi:hypothetical protein